MIYTLGDFIDRLKSSAMGEEQNVDMQSEEAQEIINDCLPRNHLVKKILKTDLPKLHISEQELREQLKNSKAKSEG